MKVIKYQYLSAKINNGTEENPDYELFFIGKTIPCTAEGEALAKAEAYNGEYEIYDDTIHVVATRNIVKGEYVTVNGAMYKAIANIPNGEPIIVGQNAIVTTVEEQLYEMMKGE